jgi:lon-related putative ATP-dependent protease
VPVELLRRRCDPATLGFSTTADLKDVVEFVGQERALEALRFGVGIARDGYNMFVLGPPAGDKHRIVHHLLEEQAAKSPPPSDLCYVYNFDEPSRPRVLQVSAGVGGRLRADMDHLIEEIRSAITSMLESEEYRTRRQVIEDELKGQTERSLKELEESAKKKDFALLRAPVGLLLAPQRDGEILSPEEFRKIPEEERLKREHDLTALQEDLKKILEAMPRREQEAREKLHELHREMTGFAVAHLLEDLRTRYEGVPVVLEHLERVRTDLIENTQRVVVPESESGAAPGGVPAGPQAEAPWHGRYRVNLMVDHGSSAGLPVVYEDNPTYANVVGRVEHVAQLGALVTDFSLIRAGALHRANGGYLILDAFQVLTQPFVWDALKRALRSRQVRLESMGQMLSLISTVSLEPEPVTLDLKVVLVGDRRLYYMLSAADPEFPQLFKVAADFDDEVDWSTESEPEYARLVAGLARREELHAFDREAVATVIEESSRRVSDSGKLTARVRELVDLLRESDHWAQTAGRKVVTAADVERAVDAGLRRAGRARERVQEEILRGTVLVDTAGERVGQINGLAVVSLAGGPFGHPMRISARVRLGKGEIVDIEREVELGGPLHSKGVLILSGFLGGRYAKDRPLSLTASLVFEQSYGGVEGDSASAAELFALLSAISEVPARQSIAVTGSVNQHGDMQPIGGVNEKIEGFFDVCLARGLTGEQGVLIPESNVKHLMLRRDVVEAAAAERFHVWPIRHVDEGIEILTGLFPGEPDSEGHYPESSFNGRVERRLAEMTERWSAIQGKNKG